MRSDVLHKLRDLGVTVLLDRSTGQLHARPRPVPDRARELLRANRDTIVMALEDPVRLLVDDEDFDAWRVGDLLPVDGDALDSYSEWVAREILGIEDEEILQQGRGVHLPYWAPPDRPDWVPGTREPGDSPRWRRPPPPTPAPEQPVRLGAEGRERYLARDGKVRDRKLVHVWMVCDRCNEGTMRKRGSGPKRCVITPGCTGSHQTRTTVVAPVAGKVDHPARFSVELLPAIARPLTEWQLPVHDPFAGTGERLGKLCDELGLTFTGTEIEPEWIVDSRVSEGDSTKASVYPSGEYVIATSPSYPNGMADHFKASNYQKRNTYRQALQRTRGGNDRELALNNTARYNIRRGEQIEAQYWRLVGQAVAHWPDRVVVNVKDFHYENDKIYRLVAKWIALLEHHGFEVVARDDVKTPGQRHGANRHRVETEAVLTCERNR